MGNAQYISDATLTGQTSSSSPSDLNPGQPGVDFATNEGASIVVPLASGVTPIIVEVSVPNTDTNIKTILVVVTAPDNTIVFTGESPDDNSNTVTGFPVEPLPEGSTVTVTWVTNDGKPAEHVTLSVIACYTPTTATTIVTTGTTTGTSVSTGTGSETSTLVITSTNVEVSETSGMLLLG